MAHPSPHILVVEDDRETRNLIAKYLRSNACNVTTATDGREMVRAMTDRRVDLLILDVMLPGIDGYSLQIKISQDADLKNMPIIVLTALEPSKTLFQKFPQVAGFMTKPFKTDELLETAQKALAKAAP